jgi:hypothetical protein
VAPSSLCPRLLATWRRGGESGNALIGTARLPTTIIDNEYPTRALARSHERERLAARALLRSLPTPVSTRASADRGRVSRVQPAHTMEAVATADLQEGSLSNGHLMYLFGSDCIQLDCLAGWSEPLGGRRRMSVELAWENLEQVARVLGQRWAKRLRNQHGVEPLPSAAWPCTLEQARLLLDEMLEAKISSDRRERLALIVERSARAAWLHVEGRGAAHAGVRRR